MSRFAASPSVARCRRMMIDLNITSQVEAIDYLRVARTLPRLSLAEIRSLVAAFPVLPAAPMLAPRRRVKS